MSIEKINGNRPVVPVGENKKAAGKNSDQYGSKDRVELSDEAKSLFASEKAKKMGEIQARVASGFYDTPEVTQKVVENLLKDLRSYSKA